MGDLVDDTGAEGRARRRRAVLKRAALIGGATVWASPVVQSIAAPALAVGGSAGTSTRSDEISIEIVLCDPLNPSQQLRLCKTIRATASDPAQRQADLAGVRQAYCSAGVLGVIVHLLLHPGPYQLGLCAAGAVPVEC